MANKYVDLQALTYAVQNICEKSDDKFVTKKESIKSIAVGERIPTDSTSSTPVPCLIVTYSNDTVVNIDISILKGSLDNDDSDSGNTGGDTSNGDNTTVIESHTHDNKIDLDLIGHDEQGNLTYDGVKVVGQSAVETVCSVTPDENKNITLSLDNIQDGTTRVLIKFDTDSLDLTGIF